MTAVREARTAMLDAVRRRWSGLAPRERRLVLAAAAVVAAAVVWLALLRPALLTLREAPAELAQLQSDVERARAQAAELRRLAAAPAATPQVGELRAQVTAWLQRSDPQARAEVAAQPSGATLKVDGMQPRTLAALAQAARHDWGAEVTQVSLKRGTDGLLSGQIQLALQTSGAAS